MNIAIKSVRQELSLQEKVLIEEKLSSLEKFTKNSQTPAQLECEIEESIAVERAGAKYRAEGNLSLDGKLYRAEALGATLEAAVDKVRDELARELRHARGKERNLFKRGGSAIKRMLRFGRE
jgi:ribosomal subunit interface protein